jgi:hypothetical protein
MGRRNEMGDTRSKRDEHDGSISTPGSADRPSEARLTRIARRAHEIYEARGGEHGKAMEDWLQAEREVDAEMEA